MTSNAPQPPAQPHDGDVAVLPRGADEATLAQLLVTLREADRLLARAVGMAGRVAGSGAAEQVEGLPLDLLLQLEAGMLGSDAAMIITAGETLADMPHLAGLFDQGIVGWGVVRRVVVDARRLSREDRAWLDARLQATFERWGGLDGYSPDQLTDAVAQALTDLRDRRNVERQEQRDERASFVSLQQRLDGRGGSIYAELDTVGFAAVVNAIDDAAGPPTGAGHDPEPGMPRERGRQRAGGLVRLADAWLAGDTGRAARPLAVVHVDVADTTVNAGRIELNTPGPLPTITKNKLEDLLNRDAQMRAVLFDGARPLAVSRLTDAVDIPDVIRRAVRARDRGCRMPGSRLPAAWTDIHHIRQRSNGGDHHPDNLVSLGRRNHVNLHRHGWTAHLDPHTGIFTITRRGRTYRSLPRGTPLARTPRPTRPPPRRE